MSKLEGRKILLVEDEPKVRKVLAARLEREGAEVTQVDSIAAALKVVGAGADTIVTDYHLGDGLGTELEGLAPMVLCTGSFEPIQTNARRVCKTDFAGLVEAVELCRAQP